MSGKMIALEILISIEKAALISVESLHHLTRMTDDLIIEIVREHPEMRQVCVDMLGVPCPALDLAGL